MLPGRVEKFHPKVPLLAFPLALLTCVISLALPLFDHIFCDIFSVNRLNEVNDFCVSTSLALRVND